jgi:hypothetical protein
MYGMIRLKNGSTIEICEYEHMDSLLSTETSIYRIDLQEMFRVPRAYYILLGRSLTKQIKATAWDASYRFMARKNIKVINVEEPHSECMKYLGMVSDKGKRLLRSYIFDEWTASEQPEPRREEPK